ncbi:FAD-dependent oxidoreductase [Wenjunlia tyrosinilytica]|uniref:D-amino-acid oxidase n=1 Tax=Wenjunlia tyrosinilytica TaxID=1544741 RepID=A0A917ZHB7_9ACTN|nr:FAD-dependent oxidoreductase [Wenjunlia tyrosinilytica]GGO82696.1 D-amino-acid oxidase [Wenjunlia tyrosinilytica]
MARTVRRVLVIGAGVSGLTTALTLAGNGLDVHVLGERPAERTVSAVAGALWEFPPAVCGQHGNPVSISRSKSWCMASYQKFAGLRTLKASTGPAYSGVRMVRANFYFTEPVESDRVEVVKRRELEALYEVGQIQGYRRLTGEDVDERVVKEFGIVDGYRLTVPAVDAPVYMGWLRRQAVHSGVTVQEGGRRVTGRLLPQEAALRKEFEVDAIVNCSGMGAAELAGAAMVPLRGALIRMPADKLNRPVIQAHALAKSRDEQDMLLVVPRGDTVMLGGLVEPGEYDSGLDKGYPPVREMYRRCQDFLHEELEGVGLDDEDVELVVGLRPYRVENVCLEREYGFNIVHNFGHAGSGFSFSWGCAREVLDLVMGMERV